MNRKLSLGQIAEVLGARVVGSDTQIASVCTDSRQLEAGATFIALTGPNHDGHEHCASALEKGANALIVEREIETGVAGDIPQLVVADTRVALGVVARCWAELHEVTIAAITGSNGKTTVKEMLASILRELGPVLSTKGNLNNEIGVPLTLLEISAEHLYAVIEMGASHAGEIGYLSKLASPGVALVNNVAAAHLEGFGSLDDVANAKSEIFQGLAAHGVAVINADDNYASTLQKAARHCQVVTFGQSVNADIVGSWDKGRFSIKLKSGAIDIDLQLLGKHNRQNALAAAAMASCLDVQPESIRAGLAKVRAVAGRLEKKSGAKGLTVIDDSYNANPPSTLAAIQVLAEQNAETVLVLGDMLELGEVAEQMHAEVGKAAKDAGIDHFYALGPLAAHAALAFGEGGKSFSSNTSLVHALRAHNPANTVFLVKGSRGSRMEKVVNGLLQVEGNAADCEVSLP